jgi:SAM-dependent methyltransferase
VFDPQGPSLYELAKQALSSTERGYDLLAPKFDRTPFRTPAAFVEATLAVGGPATSGLDLCCGTGVGLEAMHAHGVERVVGVDFSRGMLDVAAERVPSATLLQHDVLSLCLDERFELITCFGAFGHILPSEEAALVATVRHHLAPGGRFVFVTAEPPPWWHPTAVAARGFNAVMRVRNALRHPPFVMYYLTFTLPDCLGRLRDGGLEPVVHQAPGDELPAAVVVVTATRRSAG